jgi:hypothetical protein
VGRSWQAWKRTDASVARAFFLLRQEVQCTLRPLATALDAHLCELLAWTATGYTSSATERSRRKERVSDRRAERLCVCDFVIV